MSSHVQVKFLGSGDMFGSGGRFQTCILVRSVSSRFLIDCGASSLTAMKQQRVRPNDIDAILISHLHGDHFGGLPFFILEAQLVSKRTRPLILAGPPGLEERTRQAMEVFFPGSSQMSWLFPLAFVELGEKRPTEVNGLTVTAFPVVHASGAPAYALRIVCEKRVIAYSGDTEWTPALVKTADGADLFICEAYFFDKKVKYHLDYQTLMAHRGELRCRRLFITHMSDDMLGRLDMPGVAYAKDGWEIVL